MEKPDKNKPDNIPDNTLADFEDYAVLPDMSSQKSPPKPEPDAPDTTDGQTGLNQRGKQP